MKNLELTKAQLESLIYSVNLNLDYLESDAGNKREINTLMRILDKLGGERISA